MAMALQSFDERYELWIGDLDLDKKGTDKRLENRLNQAIAKYSSIAKIVEENSEKLQEIVDFIVAEFAKTGLMPKQFDRVKLHITVVNTLFRKDEEFSEEKVRETLDSRQILELFGDKSFASVTLKEVHLSQRRAGKRTKENY